MKRNLIVSWLSSVLACVVLLLIAAGVSAQGQPDGSPPPIGPTTLTGTPISSTFTYQGQLKSGGSAVSGPCDFQLGLWDAASVGLQVGVTQTLSAVNVTNGLFTVPLNFGTSVFNGDARWLGIALRCPAGSGTYAPLNPRQSITPAPYAAYASGNWGLTGNGGTNTSNFLGTTDNTMLTLGVNNGAALRLIPNPDAPILIGGYAGNVVNGVSYGSTIAGGGSSVWGGNVISGTNVRWSTISGGVNNQISGNASLSALGGGEANQISISADHSAIGGGGGNQISGNAYVSAIGGGYQNQINGSAHHSAIGSGYQNQISGTAGYSAIGSGYSNQISGSVSGSSIGSGYDNLINGNANQSAIGSGYNNLINGNASDSAIGGGNTNLISGNANQSAIGSGYNNLINGNAYNSAISGGNTNQIGGNAYNSAISGGNTNQINGNAGNAAIGGGASNVISGTNTGQSTIGGGGFNTISGTTATIPGGYGNTATGDYSFAAGTQAKANHTGAFVWGDNTFANFASTGNNQFLIRANGGVGIGTNAPAAQLHVSSSGGGVTPQLRLDQTNLNDYVRLRMVVGSDTSKGWDVAAISTTVTFYSGSAEQNVLTLTPSDPTNYMTMGNNAHLTAGGVWQNNSDRNLKANFASIDSCAVLNKVLNLPISTWNYKAEDVATRHLGPMAQDFHAAFGLGSDDRSIGTVDEEGVALAAIQGLYQVVAEKDQRITQLEKEVAQLKNAAPSLDQPFNLFNLISLIALGGVIVIWLRTTELRKHGGRS
jgi:hypothetical protein